MQEKWEMKVWSLGQEDPLNEGMATHSSTPAWKIQWPEEPGRRQLMASQKVRHDWSSLEHTHSTVCRTAGGKRGQRAETSREYAAAVVQVMANENKTAWFYLSAFLPSNTTFFFSVETKDLASLKRDLKKEMYGLEFKAWKNNVLKPKTTDFCDPRFKII